MDIVDRGKLYRFTLPSGMYVEFIDKEAADWVDGMQKEVERLRNRVESLRGLCKWAAGRLHEANDNGSADEVLRLVGDMEPFNAAMKEKL